MLCLGKFGLSVVLWCLIFSLFLLDVLCVNLVIKIPEGLTSDNNSTYRFDYLPAHGSPPPNTTFSTNLVKDSIEFSQGLPGTKYEFYLYYTNSTIRNWLSWTASITTPPDPPEDLSVNLKSGKVVQIRWSPPSVGKYSEFRLKLTSLSEKTPPKVIDLAQNASPLTLKDLTPGGSYQVQLFSVFESKESVAYTSRNFTTKPNSPGKFIVWFRNETTLLVLWHPSYPLSIYSHYQVSIDPPDAPQSVLYIEKEGNPPGPAQAAFKQLWPGRAYNISVQTVSEDQISNPTYADYRTLPSKPSHVAYEKSSITTHKVKVVWEPPKDASEFDKYQISINASSFASPILKSRDEPRMCEISEGLLPGRSYEVIVKSVSGKVASLPMAVNVTLKPLPVLDLSAWFDLKTNDLALSWKPDNASYQTSFKILYFEVEEALNGDSSQISVGEATYVLRSLLPGRNYSITVQAISNGMESNGTTIYQLTRPSPPLLEDLSSFEFGLNIAWKSDINSRQHHYEVIYNRNDTVLEATVKIETIESKVSIDHLHPGARFRIQVIAINHGLRSDTHDYYFQAVRPKPPKNLKMETVSAGAISLKWDEPTDTEFTEYVVKYRTAEEDKWSQLPELGKTSSAELFDLVPGTKYFLQVNSVSYAVESNHVLSVNHTTRPSRVSHIVTEVGSSNITLIFPRPEGRIEYYLVEWSEDSNHSESQDSGLKHAAKYYDMKGEQAQVLIDKLATGTKYQLSIRTVSNGLESEVTFSSAHTLPVIETQVIIVHDQEHTDALTLRYTPQKSHFDFYRFSISEPKVPIVEKAANDTDRKVTFSSLSPGKLYNITIWAVADEVLSMPLLKRDRLYPQPVEQINTTEITKSSVKLTWNTPKGDYNYFKVEYITAETLLVQKFTLQTTITLNDLKPYQNYTVTVNVVSGSETSILRESLPVSSVVQTLESVPGKPDSFHPIDVQPRVIVFSWSLLKEEQNGVLTKFTISYVQEDSSHVYSQDFSPTEFRGTIKSLIPGKSYVFKLQAETKVGYGPENVWKQKMPILSPPRPGSNIVPVEVYRTSTTIQIRFRRDYFSDENGAVTSYTIIVAEDFRKNSSGLEMLSWRDVQHYSFWPPYQVLEPFQFFRNTSVHDFTIGKDSCDDRPGHCNGPLKSGSTYRVKIRAFTAPDKFTDTAYSFPMNTERDSTPLVLSSAVLIVLVCAVCMAGLFFVYRRKNSGLPNKTPTFVLHNVKSRPVRLSNFANHYEIMSADSEFYFSEEFDELKNVGSSQPCTAANLACNRPKNRFTNILPYDHSRVKLQPVDDEEGSDYINANYVPGYNSPREFIATQGPLRSTRDDFWRMCWESNSPAIVMLTRCVEKGREKCDHYWPSDTFPEYNGDICVTVVEESHYPDWSITKMILCRGNHQRVIRHFHFTTWPDFGVPDPPQIVTAFVRAFRDLVRPNQKPIIVHCSAGVGRSGTFIALDRILQSLGQTDTVDVFGVVYQMRRERASMVQSEQQYVCIHQCLLAVLQGQETHSHTPETPHSGASDDDDDEGIAESEI